MKSAEKSESYAGDGLSVTLLRSFSGARFTVGVLGALVALFLVGAFVPQRGTSPVPLESLYSPETLYLFDRLGITDVFRSGWFVFVLGVAVLNLAAYCLTRLGPALSDARTERPAAVDLARIRGSGPREGYLYVEIPGAVGREDFRESVHQWVRSRIGKVHTLSDPGGVYELQLGAQRGRFHKLGGHLVHASLLLVALGALLTAGYRREARISIDEGDRAGRVQLVSGTAGYWEPLVENGRIIPGHYVPDFEIEVPRVEAAEAAPWSLIRVHVKGEAPAEMQVRAGRPASFGGMRILQHGITPNGRLTGDLMVVNPRTGATTRFGHLAVGAEREVDGVKFKIVEIDPNVERVGVAARIQYQEPGRPAGEYWVFKDYPGYDRAHRLFATLHFTLEATHPSHRAELVLVRDPGAAVAGAGGLLLVVALILSLGLSFDRYWFFWNGSGVTLAGLSDNPSLFEPRLARVALGLRNQLSRHDRSMRQASLEVQRGSG